MRDLTASLTLSAALLLFPATPKAETAGPDTVVEEQNQCSQIVKECFAQTGLKKSNCLFNSTKHPFCEGSELGKLIYKRWSLAADTTVEGRTPPGLLGPSIYDEECISKVDNKLLGYLVEGYITSSTIEQIGKDFDGCKSNKGSLEVIRP